MTWGVLGSSFSSSCNRGAYLNHLYNLYIVFIRYNRFLDSDPRLSVTNTSGALDTRMWLDNPSQRALRYDWINGNSTQLKPNTSSFRCSWWIKLQKTLGILQFAYKYHQILNNKLNVCQHQHLKIQIFLGPPLHDFEFNPSTNLKTPGENHGGQFRRYNFTNFMCPQQGMEKHIWNHIYQAKRSWVCWFTWCQKIYELVVSSTHLKKYYIVKLDHFPK